MPPAITEKLELEAIRRNKTKVYEDVAKLLGRRILEHLKPGDLLPPERELGRMLGVSRSSVRDAIRSLEVMGLVEPRQGVGTIVREPSTELLVNPLAGVLLQRRKTVEELLDVRKMLEPQLAYRAALYAGPEHIARLEEILPRQEAKAARHELTVEEDSEFHYGIALAAGNNVLLKVVDILMDLLKETRERSLQVDGRQEKSLAGHRRILAALQQGNAAAAEAAMRQHLSEIEEIVLQKL
jgi:GntR family transcriptional regulator, transcriptional repressor for pyruvate dehydrogenase complex